MMNLRNLLERRLQVKIPNRIINLLIALLLIGDSSFSQALVRGRIIDSANHALPYSTVFVSKANSSNIFQSATANDSGFFEISLDSGHYQIKFSYVGYRIKQIAMNITSSMPKADLGNIILQDSAKTLSTIAVQATRPIYNFFPGKIEYDVQNDIRNVGKTGFEILRQAPLISISGSGNIALKGKTIFLLQLNGKTVQALSANPENFLTSLDQSQIEKIEIITVPSARYSAEGITGIINIITKKNKKPGYFGSIVLADDTYNSSLTSMNIAGNKGKWGYSVMLSGNLWRNGSYNYSLEQTIGIRTTSVISQTVPKRNNLNGLASVSYQANKKNIINLDINTFNGKGTIQQNYANSHSAFSTINLLHNNIYSVGTDWENKIDSISSLVVSYKMEEQKNTSDIKIDFPYSLSNNQNRSKEHTMQADYKRKNVEVGSKIILRSFQSDFFDGLPKSTVVNYSQNIYGLYFTSTKKLSTYNIQYGLRGEYTQYQGRKNNDSVFLNDNYSNLFPSVSLDHSFKESRMNISLGYTRRIGRPQLYYLNPFVNNSNPYSQTTGNITLKPELSDNIELRLAKQDKKSNYHILTLSFQQGKNSIAGLLEPINDSSISSSFGNWRKQYLLGLSFYSSLSLWKKVQLNFSNNLYWSKYPRAFWPPLNSELAGNSGVIGSIGLSVSGSFLKRVRYSVTNSFNLPDVYIQGHGSSFFYQDFTFTCPFSKNRFLGVFTLFVQAAGLNVVHKVE